MTVFLVYAYDYGGNTGHIVLGVFSTREKAEAYANDPKHLTLNNAFGRQKEPPQIEERELDDPR